MEPPGAHIVGIPLPSFPGLTFRRFRGTEDLASMAEVVTRSREADGYELVKTIDELAAEFTNPPDFDPAADVVLAEAEGRIVGLARMWRRERQGGTLGYQHSVELVPEWRRPGLRDALFDYNERHAGSLAAQDSKKRPHLLALWAYAEENEWKALAVRHGYRETQHFLDLVRSLDDLPEIPLPEGIEVRPAMPADVRKVWDLDREASREEWGFSEARYDDAHLDAFRRSPDFQPDLWQLAWDGDTLVGMVLPFILDEENRRYGRRQGHTENVCVREGYRRRGIARALLARSLRVLRDRGMDEATLGTEVENPHRALRVYESLGFRIVEHFTWYEKPL